MGADRWATPPEGVPAETWARFLEYHKRNREVWAEFESLALEAIQRGAKRWGAKGIFELIRWNRLRDRGSEFKCCNSFAAYYARVFARKYPQFADFFEFKTVTGLALKRVA